MNSVHAFTLIVSLFAVGPAVSASPPCVSVGSPSNGSLRHGVQLKGSEKLRVREGRNWGTPEMVEAIERAVDAVHKRHPRTPRLVVGDLSRERGGRFPPHVSHQSGRDADLGYYFKGGVEQRWFKRADSESLDVRRTWTLIESMLEAGAVEMMFVDYALQRELYRYARSIKRLDEETLKRYFSYPRAKNAKVGLIRHWKGHADHMHIRFRAPHSQSQVRQAKRTRAGGLTSERVLTAKVKRGDTLYELARRFGTSVDQLRKWNSLERRSIIKPGQVLVVGIKGSTGQ